MGSGGALTVILGALLGVSEALSLIPGIKSNGIFQLFYNLIAGALGKDKLPPAA